MIPLEIYFNGFALIVYGIIIGGWLLYEFYKWFSDFWYHIIKTKAWAKVCKPNYTLFLDRKYWVEYKKHWWNKYNIYHNPNRKYDTDYLYSEACDIKNKIESGEIKI